MAVGPFNYVDDLDIDEGKGLTRNQLQFLLQWYVEGASIRFQSAEDSDYGADAGCAERRRRRQV